MIGRIGGLNHPKVNAKVLRNNHYPNLKSAHILRQQSNSFLSNSESRDPYFRRPTAVPLDRVLAPSQDKIRKLPVFKALPAIIKALKDFDIVALDSATGSGKTLLTPKALVDAGFNRVFCLEPTQVATVSAAETVAKIWDQELGQEIAYCHGNSKVRGPDAKIIYATNGYQLAYDLGNNFRYEKGDVIIFDEAHRPSVSMEFHLALLNDLRERAKKDASIIMPKILIASATINIDEYKEFFGFNIPVVKVSGRNHTITVIEEVGVPANVAASWFRKVGTVLVFLPGVREINALIEKVKKIFQNDGLEVPIYPLHSKLLQAQQMAAINDKKPKVVVATNAAQESLTVEGVKAVIESGLVRKKVLIGGVPSLITERYSQFDSTQQEGRTGRQGDGFAIKLVGVPLSSLEPQPRPSIQTSELASEILKILASPLAITPERLQRLKFLHPVEQFQWDREFKRLRDLGLVSPRNYIIKRLDHHGRRAARLPLAVSLAKMIVVAEDLALKNGNIDILRRIVDVVAVVHTEGILLPKSKHLWLKLGCDDVRSEPLTQAAIFHKALSMPVEELEEYGISTAQFYRCKRLQEDLYRRLNIGQRPDEDIHLNSKHDSKQVISDEACVFKAIWSGMANTVYRLESRQKRGENSKTFPEYRALSNREDKEVRTVYHFTRARAPDLIVGFPFNFKDMYSEGEPRDIHTLSAVTAISASWLSQYLSDKQDIKNKQFGPLKRYANQERNMHAAEDSSFFLPSSEKQTRERNYKLSKSKGDKNRRDDYVNHLKGNHRER